MFTHKQFNPFFKLVLFLTAICLSNCSDKSEYGEASDYEKLGAGSSGSGIIKGTVLDNASDALPGVSVTFAKSGTTSSVVTTVDNGTYSKTSLSSGTYTLTYTKSGFIDTTLSATLTADNETLTVATVKQFPDTCASGAISGTIKDAVSDSVVSDVSLSVRSGLNMTSGTIIKTATTDSSGNYSLSSMSAGWYTVETSKSGYITGYFNVYACGNQANQDASISTSIDSGTMRIVLHWDNLTTNVVKILDSHLTGTDNLSGQGHTNNSTNRFHLYYNSISGVDSFYYATNNFSCTSCSDTQKSDNVTLDNDDFDGAPGTETITINKVRSGTYRYSVHDFSNKGLTAPDNLSKSGATVIVYYNDTTTTYNVPNNAGSLWTVFTFDSSSGFTAVNGMSDQLSASNIQYY
jgi:hypothetical protein